MTERHPNPVRSLPSLALVENVDGCGNLRKIHEMVSCKTGSEQIPYVERCWICGWIDTSSLDWWADNIAKATLSRRAERIAIAADLEPFQFVQSIDEELTLEEVLYQALGAASMCWIPAPHTQEFDSSRAKQIGEALMAEVRRFQRLGNPDVKAWSDLAYEFYALACNAKPGQHADEETWGLAFVRLKDEFHRLLDGGKDGSSGNGGSGASEAGVHGAE